MHGLIERMPLAQAGRGQQANGTGDHRGLIAQNISEDVVRQNHVERGGLGDQLHGASIDIEMAQFHVRIRHGDALDHLAPQLGAFQHVGLIDRRNAPAADSGQLKSPMSHPLNLMLAVDLRVDADPLAVS